MNHEPLHIDLFSGIGGFSLAFEAAGFRTIGFCEFDPDRQRDLRHHWPGVPIVGDINDIDAICRVVADSECTQEHEEQHGAEVHEGERGSDRLSRRNSHPPILTAGVPCQPASAAGKRKGSGDDRWLWPATLRVVARVRPDWCVFENPLGIASLAQPAAIPGVDLERLRDVPGRTICEILTAIRLLGYEFPTDRDGVPWIPVVPAAGVGAFHGRDRLWIIARRGDVDDSKATASWDLPIRSQSTRSGHANTGGDTLRSVDAWSDAILEQGQDGKWRAVKPGLRLLSHGVPRRTSKLRGFGNSICPQVAHQIAKAIYQQMT